MAAVWATSMAYLTALVRLSHNDLKKRLDDVESRLDDLESRPTAQLDTWLGPYIQEWQEHCDDDAASGASDSNDNKPET
jgi:hypothetical protein